MSPLRIATAAAAVTVALLSVLFFRRGFARLKSGLLGAIMWWFGGLMGVQLTALGAWVLQHDQGGDATYSIVQQILRAGLLLTAPANRDCLGRCPGPGAVGAVALAWAPAQAAHGCAGAPTTPKPPGSPRSASRVPTDRPT